MITHSTKDGGKTYAILCHGKEVGRAYKKDGNFRVASEYLPVEFTHRTMKDLKESILVFLPEAVRTKPAKEKSKSEVDYLTLKDAFTRCAMSHSVMGMTIREIRKIWPDMPKRRWGEYIWWKHLFACAQWPWGKAERQYIETHEPPEWFSPEEELRRVEKFYGARTWA